MTDRELEQYLSAYGDMVYRVAWHALGSPSEAEDVCQEVFLRLYETGKVFASSEHVKHWLIRVAVNQCRRIQRSPWRRKVVPLAEYDSPGAVRDDHSDVLDAVLALPGKYRLAVYLYYYEELSVKEAARVLNVKESTLQTRLQRAREKLRLTLQDNETEGNDHV